MGTDALEDHPGPWIDRRAVRALITDPSDGAVLLMQTQFPAWTNPRWLTPGGGIDAGEGPEQALVREIREETNLRISTADIIAGPVWRRRARFEFDGRYYDQREQFFVVRAERFEPDPRGNPAQHETEALHGFAWWTAAMIAASDDLFVPTAFAVHLAHLQSQGSALTPVAPVDVGR